MSAEPPPPPEPPAPAPPVERVLAMDVLRGIAILGILPVNLPSFALPMALTEETHAVSPAASEAVVQAVLYALIDFKLISIFALLFGCGLELQAYGAAKALPTPLTAKVVQARWDEVPRMLRRVVGLGSIGLLHAWLLWYGDILFTYGLVGTAVVMLLALPLRPRPLAAIGAAALCVPVLFMLMGAGLSLTGAIEEGAWLRDPAMPATVADALAAPDQPASARIPPGREVLLHREGGLAATFGLRVETWVVMCFMILVYYGWRVGGLMLLGAAAVRGGLLRPDDGARRALGRLAFLGVALGLPVEALRAWILTTGGVRFPASALLEAAHQLSSLGVALGLAALAILVPARWLARAPLRWLGAAGRASLSCYLTETLVCLAVFDGLGWFGHMTRVQLLLFALAVWLGLVALWAAWGRVFMTGPVEWAWRTLSDGKPRPLRWPPAPA